ncbi:acyl-CoA dehydrogenase family protein [Bacillus sp. B15-48]|uniref:acyl-CoA dehydrogenase family protein n=1 Tax=Bacillus sp. B15-48 TaxID=1548601 RepID=UPI00194013C2|nr:acyl-CoA dehydrogenase family protein [Bacillus sp. B15-48]MBM4763135.1 acyl-CoA dehydrogenase [Bacillus sp. B15-48]
MINENVVKDRINEAEQLVKRAAGFVPQLRAQGKEIDDLRRIPEETIEAFKEAGLFKLGVPKVFGGHQVNFRTFIDVNSEIASGNGSASWVTTLTNVCNWLVATLFPKDVQQEVFGDGEARTCGVLEPRKCEVRRVEGGYVIEYGFWGFGSGSLHANWAVLGIPIVDENGKIIDQGMAILPMKDIEIKDDWYTTGLRGSGSNSLEVRGVFVPERRVVSISKAIVGEYQSGYSKEETLYHSALVPVFALVLLSPPLGMARAALEVFLEKLPNRKIQYTWHTSQAEATVTHLKVAEAAMKIDSAFLHVYRAADDIDRWAASGEYMDLHTRARVRMDSGYAVRLCWDAIDILASEGGGSLIAENNLLSQIVRDARGATNHGVLVPSTNFELYGRILCGQEPNTVLV